MTESWTSLPVLNIAELRAIFRDDERAIWRYQVLAALIHDGQSPGEVAERFGTTVETVRNLRLAFGEGGTLDGLRTKRRGAAGHLGRQTPLAQAVARELAATPDSSANEIWRRVNEQLAPSGVAVPRRSIYRLVERIRPQAAGDLELAEDALWPPALVPALRSALPLLAAEPPIDLGRSALAGRLRLDEADDLERGRATAALLNEALAAIGPRPGDDPRDARFRPYQILVGEARLSRTREELQVQLAVAPATYTRAKRQGLERVAELLVNAVRQRRRAGSHALPPDPAPLFGRERELEYYSSRLQTEGLALIWGLPGSGKSALASTIAAQQQAAGIDVVWHVCDGTGEQILYALFGSIGLTRPVSGGDLAGLLGELRARLPQGGLLVLENFERIANDPLTDVLMATLRAGAEPRAGQLLVCSRVLPVWAEDSGWLSLGGLPEDLARPLWSGLGGRALAPNEWPALMQRTLGYPGFLRSLAADPASDLEATLIERATEVLSPAAKRLLWDLLVCGAPYVSAGEPDVSLQLAPERELALHGLLTYEADRAAYHLHPLLAAGRARLVALVPDRGEANRRLAQRALAAGDWLTAAQRLAEAGEYARALETLAGHHLEFAGERESHAGLALAQLLVPRMAPGAPLAVTHGVLGTLRATLGSDRSALAELRTALELVRIFNGVAAADVRRWQRICADLYVRSGDWPQAMAHVQAAMSGEQRIGDDIPPDERFALTLLQHRIWLAAGEAERARYWLADAQMLAQIRGDEASATAVDLAEGLQSARRGNYAAAIRLLQPAVDRLRGPGQHGGRYLAAAQLARCLAAQGDFDAARALLVDEQVDAQARDHHFGVVELAIARADIALGVDALPEVESALGTAQRWHDESNQRHEADLALLHGRLVMHSAPVDTAFAQITRAITLASTPANVELRAAANLELAMWLLERGDATTAAQYAAAAWRQADTAGLERTCALANICLAREAVLRRAFQEAKAALEAAQLPFSDALVDAERQQLRAELHAARGETDDARRDFNESIQALRRGPATHRRWAEQRFATFMRGQHL